MSSAESSRASSLRNTSSHGTETGESDGSVSRPESAGGAAGDSGDEHSSSGSARRDNDTNSESSRGSRSDASRQDSRVGEGVDSGDSGGGEARTSESGSQQDVEEDDAASSSSREREATGSSDRSEDSGQRTADGSVVESHGGGDTDAGGGGRSRDRLSRGGFSPSEKVSERSGRSDGTNSARSSRGNQSSDKSDGRGEPNERSSGSSNGSRVETSHTPDREQSEQDVESGSDSEDRSDGDSRNTGNRSPARSLGTPREVDEDNHRGQAEKKTRGSSNRTDQRNVASATKIQRNVRKRQAQAITRDRRRQKAATTIQAGTRGRRARRKLFKKSTMPAGRTRGSSDTAEGITLSREAGEYDAAGEDGSVEDGVIRGRNRESTSDERSKEGREAAIAAKRRDLVSNQVVELEVGSGRSGQQKGKDQRVRKREKSGVGEEEEGLARKTKGGNLRGDMNASYRNGERHKGTSSSRSSADSSGEGVGERVAKRDHGAVGLSRAIGSGRGHGSEEHEAATRIQRKARQHAKRKHLREARDGDSRRGDGGGRGMVGNDPVTGCIPLQVRHKWICKDSRSPYYACAGGRSLERRAPRHAGGIGPAARSPSPSQLGHQGSTPWMSPGKAAANAAAAAAKEAAKAAAASVRAAEAAADAAEAAEAAAEAEEESQLSQSQPRSESRSQGFHSPPARKDFEEKQLRDQRRERSPARSAFYLTEGVREEGDECLEANGTPKSGRYDKVSTRGADGEAGSVRGDRSGGYAGGAEGRNHQPGDRSGSTGSEQQMLKRARDQARRHARDRRARARAKEEESKRELQAVQAELAKAEELRDRQAMVEKSALEAKRARVLDDMKRRQLRLQRLQEEEGRRGGSHPSSPSRSSSTDAAASERLHRRVTPKREPGGGASYPRVEAGADGGVGSVLSLPPVARAGRKPRHVSAFRERILEERRVRKEVDLLKRKELEDRHSRQAEYAAKIRAQAKRALAAEQRRAQEDAERNARRRSGQSSTVDRTPIAIKRPKREGEWGVFSYAPDRPPGGAAPRKAQGLSPDGRPAASGFGSTEKVQQRLGSSELHRFDARQDGTRHRPSEPNGTAYKDKGKVEEVLPHRPLPPSKQRSGVPAGGRGAGCRRVDAARQGASNTTPQRRNRPAIDRGEADIHALYEKRLAALEQQRSSPRDPSGASDAISAGKEGASGADSKSNGKHQQRKPPGWSKPHGETDEWREENNPFGYRKLSAGRVQSSGSVPSSGLGGSGSATLSRRGSDASGGEDLEGLSTMYMGPIAHKMAELRAENG
ncbi:unnamed protein product [Scytosiphon promiscuus]